MMKFKESTKTQPVRELLQVRDVRIKCVPRSRHFSGYFKLRSIVLCYIHWGGAGDYESNFSLTL